LQTEKKNKSERSVTKHFNVLKCWTEECADMENSLEVLCKHWVSHGLLLLHSTSKQIQNFIQLSVEIMPTSKLIWL